MKPNNFPREKNLHKNGVPFTGSMSGLLVLIQVCIFCLLMMTSPSVPYSYDCIILLLTVRYSAAQNSIVQYLSSPKTRVTSVKLAHCWQYIVFIFPSVVWDVRLVLIGSMTYLYQKLKITLQHIPRKYFKYGFSSIARSSVATNLPLPPLSPPSHNCLRGGISTSI